MEDLYDIKWTQDKIDEHMTAALQAQAMANESLRRVMHYVSVLRDDVRVLETVKKKRKWYQRK